MRLILVICLLFLSCMPAVAQSGAPQQSGKPALNQTNGKGQRQGLWWIQQPERMGEPAYTEFGTYESGRKYGIWYKIDDEGALISMEQYRNNVLDGEAKYFEQGHLVAVGNYRGLNPAQPYDTIIVVDPRTGLEQLRRVATDHGSLRHGLWRFYDPETGRLIRETEYQVDEVISSKDFQLTPIDSAYYRERTQAMPHNRKHLYTPPPGKQFRYSNY